MRLCAHVRGHLSGSPGTGEVSALLGPAARPSPWQCGSPPIPWAGCSCSRHAWIKAVLASFRPCVGLPASGLSLLCFLPGATRVTRFRGGLHAASARPTGHCHTAAGHLRVEFRAWCTPTRVPRGAPSFLQSTGHLGCVWSLHGFEYWNLDGAHEKNKIATTFNADHTLALCFVSHDFVQPSQRPSEGPSVILVCILQVRKQRNRDSER